MNEKFWDLNKIKQRSMIGGALKVFARDGFRHASTDEIVLEAGISKGLLFHYFYNKTGLYEFLAEFCARFALVELDSVTGKAASDNSYENLEDVLSYTSLYTERRSAVLKESVLPQTMSPEDAGKISRLLDLARKDTALGFLEKGSFDPEGFTAGIKDLVNFFENMYK